MSSLLSYRVLNPFELSYSADVIDGPQCVKDGVMPGLSVSVQGTLDDDSYREIARFLNPAVDSELWSSPLNRKSLLTALGYWYAVRHEGLPSCSFSYGSPTVERPLSIGAPLMYERCLRRHIFVPASSSLDQLYVLTRRFSYSKLESIDRRTSSLDRKTLVPTSDTEAIYLGMRVRGLDLSRHARPLARFASSGRAPRSHHETDFNPLLPYFLYDPAHLIALGRKYGIDDYGSTPSSSSYMEDLHRRLSSLHEQGTFVPCDRSTRHRALNVETPIDREDVADVPDHELVCYGNWRRGYGMVRIDELLRCFRYHSTFVTPLIGTDAGEFTLESIARLRNIVLLEERRAIDAVAEARLSIQSQGVSSFNDAASFLEGMDALLHSALAMRGLSSLEEFVSSELGYDNDKKWSDVWTDTAERLSVLVDRPAWYRIAQMRCFRWTGSHMAIDQKTIGERIASISDRTDEDACIRSNSNFLLATACQHLHKAGRRLPFSFDRIRNIG